MAAPALTVAAFPAVIAAAGAAANLVARPQPLPHTRPLQIRRLTNLARSRTTAPGAPDGAATPAKTPDWGAAAGASSRIKPIGGKTDKDPPPTPFGRFPRHRPMKLPGPPKSYDPSTP